jgi:hypothetical protein
VIDLHEMREWWQRKRSILSQLRRCGVEEEEEEEDHRLRLRSLTLCQKGKAGENGEGSTADDGSDSCNDS